MGAAYLGKKADLAFYTNKCSYYEQAYVLRKMIAMKTSQLSLFLFHRDLRLEDNTALREACIASEVVIPLFIFDPRQVSEENNYRSLRALHFLIESLKDLSEKFASAGGMLFVVYGNTQKIIHSLLHSLPIDTLYSTIDYTPFSKERDAALVKTCTAMNRSFYSFHDVLLIGDPEKLKNKSGTFYQKFTPFFNAAQTLVIQKPRPTLQVRWWTGPFPLKTIDLKKELTKAGSVLKISQEGNAVHGGRNAGKAILRNLRKQRNYNELHNFLSFSTTKASAYLKFGCISIREFAHEIIKILGPTSELLRQLYWRDMFTYLAIHQPHVFGHACNPAYEHIPWRNSPEEFERWCLGKTGVPLVDAGMHELIATGLMHNRARLVTASFLTKNLRIDWRWGERYFAQHLIDYDPAVNNGNWQWVASTGCCAQQPFRRFNPKTQQKRFDPENVYIDLWK